MGLDFCPVHILSNWLSYELISFNLLSPGYDFYDIDLYIELEITWILIGGSIMNSVRIYNNKWKMFILFEWDWLFILPFLIMKVVNLPWWQQYLKSFGINQSKGIFCVSWILMLRSYKLFKAVIHLDTSLIDSPHHIQ